MDEVTKQLVGQGVLGIVCLTLGFACRRLWLENKSLTDRLEAKADKHAELNRETAREVTQAFETAMRTSTGEDRARRRATKLAHGDE